MTIRPANYEKLTSSAKAIVDDHLRAGVNPPKFTPPSNKQLSPSRYPLTYDIMDD